MTTYLNLALTEILHWLDIEQLFEHTNPLQGEIIKYRNGGKIDNIKIVGPILTWNKASCRSVALRF